MNRVVQDDCFSREITIPTNRLSGWLRLKPTFQVKITRGSRNEVRWRTSEINFLEKKVAFACTRRASSLLQALESGTAKDEWVENCPRNKCWRQQNRADKSCLEPRLVIGEQLRATKKNGCLSNRLRDYAKTAPDDDLQREKGATRLDMRAALLAQKNRARVSDCAVASPWSELLGNSLRRVVPLKTDACSPEQRKSSTSKHWILGSIQKIRYSSLWANPLTANLAQSMWASLANFKISSSSQKQTTRNNEVRAPETPQNYIGYQAQVTIIVRVLKLVIVISWGWTFNRHLRERERSTHIIRSERAVCIEGYLELPIHVLSLAVPGSGLV